MHNKMLQRICEAGLIAALYTILTVCIPAISYGQLQLRLSEILTILPAFTPAAIPGLTLGCFLSNLFGLTSGANVAGAWDLLIGPVATLFASILCYLLRNITWLKLPFLSLASPILLNGLFIGLEFYYVFSLSSTALLLLCVGEIALSELLSAGIGGALLYTLLTKSNASKLIFRNGDSV